MRNARPQRLVAVVTVLALLLGSVGPLVQQVCAGMGPTAPGQETCAHHDGTAGDAPCPHADRDAESGDTVEAPTMDCCDAAAWSDGEARLPTRLDGAPLDGRSVRSVRAPMRPDVGSDEAIHFSRAPVLSARMHLFLRHDTFLE